jgi:hypothetical protein
MPHALEVLGEWMEQAGQTNHRVIQCSKLNFTGEPFFWQYRYSPRLCMLNPFSKSGFAEGERCKPMNTVCFEGGLFHRSVVERIGLPDPRFFIHWDDTAYGYLASKVCEPILIPDILMQRTRETDHLRVGKVRKLNVASDMVRYRTMRNRGYLARYAKLQGDYNPVTFAFGTLLVFAQEALRLVIAARVAKTAATNAGASGAGAATGAGAGAGGGAQVVGASTAGVSGGAAAANVGAVGASRTAAQVAAKGATRKSLGELFRGMRDARAILHDRSWEPMPSLVEGATKVCVSAVQEGDGA